MFYRKRFCAIFLAILLLLVAALPGPVSHAQLPAVTVSLAVPEYMSSIFTPEVLGRFEAAHPGVKVNLVKTGEDAYFPPAAFGGIDKHLEGALKYAALADVVFVTSNSLSVETSRAGYFLNLMPLVNGEAAFRPEDYYPSLWQAFQWDTALWALPLSSDVAILSYDPAAFDAAGLTYPDEKWTIHDLLAAAEKLTTQGNTPIPGFFANGLSLLFGSLTGEPFYDSTVYPNPPRLATPRLESLLDAWAKFTARSSAAVTSYEIYEQVPIRIDFSNALMDTPGRRVRVGALLPGGKAGLLVQGFAVSAGTQNPNQAFALADFLTGDAEVASRLFDFTPARKSLAESKNVSDRPPASPFSPQVKAVLDKALEVAISPSTLLYGDYVDKALENMQAQKLDAGIALQQAEAEATANLKTAEARRNAKLIVISTPVPTLAPESGKITLKFKIVPQFSPLPNRQEWDRLIQEFVSADPQVGQIVLDANFDNNSFEDYAQKYDCFFTPYNVIPYTADLSFLLNLDPFLKADPSFDKDDFIGSALTQFQLGDKTWGYPLQLQPQALLYNPDLFAKAGIELPAPDWNISTFIDILKTLKERVTDQAPFTFFVSNDNHLLMLIAASGGLPLDYRTNPPTIQFTDTATIEAIRQILDLAKQGYIKYQKLTGSLGVSAWGGSLGDPIYGTNLSSFADNARREPYQWINYPRGNRFTPVSYGASAAYISAKTTNPEACYRWISAIARHPELLWSMPARHSLLDSPALTAQGADIASLYKQIDALIRQPGAVSLPLTGDAGGPGTFFLQYWLYRAFDQYILEGADLEQGLREAETLAKGYQACVTAIPSAASASSEETIRYFGQIDDCAFKIDPGLKLLFQGGR